jgi:HTH-type transcriptional regulator/antitoxin HigA
MGALVIDNKKYARVLAKVLPRVITTDEEHERMLAEVEKLMDKGEHRTAEEDAALDLMVRLVKDYEEEHHPLPDPSPHEILVYLMEQRSLKQADLLPIFKSRGYVSDVINAKRAISKVHAKQLAEFFQGLGEPIHLTRQLESLLVKKIEAEQTVFIPHRQQGHLLIERPFHPYDLLVAAG